MATPLSSRKTRRAGSSVGSVAPTACGRRRCPAGPVRRRAPFFLRVKPSFVTARQIVARLADVPSATCRSASVRSGRSSKTSRSCGCAHPRYRDAPPAELSPPTSRADVDQALVGAKNRPRRRRDVRAAGHHAATPKTSLTDHRGRSSHRWRPPACAGHSGPSRKVPLIGRRLLILGQRIRGSRPPDLPGRAARSPASVATERRCFPISADQRTDARNSGVLEGDGALWRM